MREHIEHDPWEPPTEMWAAQEAEQLAAQWAGQVPGSGVTVFEVVGGLYLSGLQGRHHLRAHHGLLLRGQGLT
ncbi:MULTISPECIES: hypothetical protein, partial [unclassified Micrococcus]|uniref:hypothetical protein n=1 Tax=unclassified Micrococcus TaxID=2620948 RepID=UPI001EE8D5EE